MGTRSGFCAAADGSAAGAETGNAKDHHDYRERIDVIADVRVGPVLRLVNDARHDEQEHLEVHDRERELFIAPEPAFAEERLAGC